MLGCCDSYSQKQFLLQQIVKVYNSLLTAVIDFMDGRKRGNGKHGTKMPGWKSQDWKMQDQICRVGKGRTGKHENMICMGSET